MLISSPKLKDWLFEGLLLALVGKAMLIEPSIASALIVISLVVSICYTKHYLAKKAADLTQEQVDKLDDAHKKVSGLIAAQAFRRDSNGQKK